MQEPAIVVTQVIEISDEICDHGCKQAVRLTNVLTDTSWVMCIGAFEKHIGNSLQMLDCAARHGHDARCNSCPYGFLPEM